MDKVEQRTSSKFVSSRAILECSVVVPLGIVFPLASTYPKQVLLPRVDSIGYLEIAQANRFWRGIVSPGKPYRDVRMSCWL
jgi:hypothetical protein